MILPNFLIIGAARSGTTSLYNYVKEHPDVYLPAQKRPEPHFFLKEEEYRKGTEYYSRKYFSSWSGEKALGECSTSYLYQQYVPELIKENIPAVRLVAILRNPIDRAFSNYLFSKQNGLEKLSFEEAIRVESRRINTPKPPFWQAVQPHAYVDRGRYFTQLSRYLALFKRNRLLILLFEDLKDNPAAVVKQTFCFLGVDSAFVPQSLGKVFNSVLDQRSSISLDVRRRLSEVFFDENAKLSQLIDRDLSHWI